LAYSQKLRRLADRRHGLYTRDGAFDFVTAALSTNLLRKSERYESLAEPEAVKYAVGAMQPVEAAYTLESYTEGGRVRDRLAEGLDAAKIPAAFEFQGSVPLDVHVRGNSDVDLLVLHDAFVTYDDDAKTAFPHLYTGPYGKSAIDELRNLRSECSAILTRRYYGAKVDTSKSKAITLSEGSLKRMVDVVPAHWHNTVQWHQTYDKRNRDIQVYDSKNHLRIRNKPFMHIGLIEDKCKTVQGALRKVIRLLKNLRYDADKPIDLSSYDIAAMAWQMSDKELTVPFRMDLLLVERARLHVQYIINNPLYRDALYVPDGSRKIFDTPEKRTAVQALYKEIERLSEDMAKELNPVAALFGNRSDVLAKAIQL